MKFLLSTLIFLRFICTGTATSAEVKPNLMQDSLLMSVYSEVSNAVAGYYGEATQFALYDARVVTLTQSEDGSSEYTLVLKIYPFEGAHNTIGEDTLTVDISPYGTFVTKYLHKKLP